MQYPQQLEANQYSQDSTVGAVDREEQSLFTLVPQPSFQVIDVYEKAISKKLIDAEATTSSVAVKYSFTYLCLDEIARTPGTKHQAISDHQCFDEAARLIRKLLPPQALFYETGKGESVFVMEEGDQHSAIPVALKLINVVRAKFQLSATATARVGLSAGILILSPRTSKPNTTVIIETARQLCLEARELGNNALQIYDVNFPQDPAAAVFN